MTVEPVTVEKEEKLSLKTKLKHLAHMSKSEGQKNQLKIPAPSKTSSKQSIAKSKSSSSGSKSTESSSISQDEEKIIKKYATIMARPQEFHDQLFSFWSTYEFGILADVSESQGNSEIAFWARKWITTQ